MQEPADTELLRQYAEQDSGSAFAALVTRHVNLVYSAAVRKTGNPHAAEEITQVVFIILAKKARTLRRETVLAGWLYQTARLTAANFLRSEIRRVRREQESSMQALSPETEAEAWPQIEPLLDDAMGRLNEKERNAIVLRFFEGKSFLEIGATFGGSENAAKKRVVHGLEKLRKFFTKRGVTLSSVAIAGTISANSVQAAPVALAKTVTIIAITKGMAASGSTLTLIKGALKLMAWTNAKTAVVVGVGILFAAGTATVTVKEIAAIRNARHDIQGTWEGNQARGRMGVNRSLPARERMVLRLSKNNGDYTATADLIDWGYRNIPVAVEYSYPSLRLSITPQVILDGKVNANGTQLNFGSFTLERTNVPDLVPEALTQAAFTPRAGSDLQGYWKGIIDFKPNGLPVDLKFAEDAGGTVRVEVDNPNQGAVGQPATAIYQRPNLQLMLATRSGMFQGQMNADNTEIAGSWMEGRQTVSANFRRADYEADHVQDALKDYSFHSGSDLQGHWEGGFLLREKPVKFPIVLDLEIAKMPDGNYSATVASIYQLGNDGPRPASDFQYAAPNLQIAWKWMNDRFVGQLKNGKLTGTWINGSKEWPIVFERKLK
jgi:RNA polymerase sigma factor (sigma-70 family)